MRKTLNKIPASTETLKKFHSSAVWQLEHEFYQFAKDHFHFVKRKTFDLSSGIMEEKKQQFMYEKIRPR